MPDSLGPPVEVFRTHSSIEAEVVRGLLDAHGLDAMVSSVLSLAAGFGHTEFRISVDAGAAGTAPRAGVDTARADLLLDHAARLSLGRQAHQGYPHRDTPRRAANVVLRHTSGLSLSFV